MDVNELMWAGFTKRQAVAIVASAAPASPLWIARISRGYSNTVPPGLLPWAAASPQVVFGGASGLIGDPDEELTWYLRLPAEGVYSTVLQTNLTWEDDPGVVHTTLDEMEGAFTSVDDSGVYWHAKGSLQTSPKIFLAAGDGLLLGINVYWDNDTELPVAGSLAATVTRWS